jgi:hypothetical protein
MAPGRDGGALDPLDGAGGVQSGAPGDPGEFSA